MYNADHEKVTEIRNGSRIPETMHLIRMLMLTRGKCQYTASMFFASTMNVLYPDAKLIIRSGKKKVCASLIDFEAILIASSSAPKIIVSNIAKRIIRSTPAGCMVNVIAAGPKNDGLNR